MFANAKSEPFSSYDPLKIGLLAACQSYAPAEYTTCGLLVKSRGN